MTNEIIFKVKTDFPGGVYINGVLITSQWKEYVSTSFYEACSQNPNVETNVFKDGKYAEIKAPVKKEEPKKESKEDFVARATMAELKIYLMDHGHTKKEVNNLNKKNLIKLVLEG